MSGAGAGLVKSIVAAIRILCPRHQIDSSCAE